MKVICNNCGKEFRLQSNVKEKYSQDGLCGKCRTLKNNPSDKYRKNNTCPDCGKIILNISKYCNSCSQLEERNHSYKHGGASKSRVCISCGDPISSGSKRGNCLKCYLATIHGSGNPNYKYGHYMRDFYNTAKYKCWKLSVLERDNWTCALCGERDRTNAHTHHIHPKRNHPELVYDVDNGIVLCPKCHEATYGAEHKYTDHFLSLIRPNQNSVNTVNAEMPTPYQAQEIISGKV